MSVEQATDDYWTAADAMPPGAAPQETAETARRLIAMERMGILTQAHSNANQAYYRLAQPHGEVIEYITEHEHLLDEAHAELFSDLTPTFRTIVA